jgi:hypothetical protein
MIKIELTHGSRRPSAYSIPQSWWEVPTNKVLRCLRLLNQPRLSPQAAELRILSLLSGIGYRTLLAIRPSDLVAICSHLSWLYQSAGPSPLMDNFAYMGMVYHLPKAKAENMSCLEFALCEDYYEEAITQDDPVQASRAMLLLAATLCRHGQADKEAARAKGDLRVPLTAREEVEVRADRLQRLPAEYVHLALLYWVGTKEYLATLYGKWLFEKPNTDDEENTDPDEPESPRKNQLFGWWGVYMDVAEKNIFGNLDAVHQTNLHTLCMYLIKQVEQGWEMERRIEMQKNIPSSNH